MWQNGLGLLGSLEHKTSREKQIDTSCIHKNLGISSSQNAARDGPSYRPEALDLDLDV